MDAKFKAGKGGDNRTAPGPMVHLSRPKTDNKATTGGVGLQDGLSAHEKFNSEMDCAPSQDYTKDPLTGNATERPEPYDTKSVSKNGISFDLVNG